MKELIYKVMLPTVIFFLVAISPLIIATAYANDIVDYNQIIIEQQPYNVKICKNVTVSGDKTADTLTGAILGGILGNNIKGEENGGAIGAIIGGMLGNANSDARAGTKRVCSTETRYRETERTVYSYSTITFVYEGVTYTLKFNKN